MRPKIAVYLLIVLFLYNGCNYSRQFSKPHIYSTQLGTMAVLPFDNRTSHPQAGAIATDLFTTELLSKNCFNVITPIQVYDTLSLNRILDATDILSAHSMQELGTLFEADTILIGSVTEYYYKKGIRETPVVGLDIKIVVTVTGETIWAESITREEIAFLFYQGSLNETTQKLCRQLINNLKNNLR
ncbi:MAG: DUF799 family lipoprotein [Candidatus Auribacterota bacterium]|jgi:hypothetical protein|nr:DUF799 family lipoprotein [Candidatus Auribacterota bacterium]